MKIVLYDAMSVLRARIEARERFLLRGVINDALRKDVFQIWVWDGNSGNAARRALFPKYKSNRKPVRSDIFESLYLIRQVIALTPAWQARLDGFEGDDVIAALVEHFRAKGEVEVHSRDGDLMALGVPVVGAKLTVPASQVRLYKLTVGDSSDCIPGIKGFGETTWENVKNKDALREFIAAVLVGAPWDEALPRAIGLNATAINWLKQPENVDQLRIMKRIIEPLPMTREQLDAALVQGRDAPIEREIILKEFHL